MKRIICLVLIASIVALIMVGCAHAGHRYTVIFDIDGQTINHRTKDGVVTIPDDPTKDGYVFEGWYLRGGDHDGELFLDVYPDGAGIGTDLTVEARWKETPCEVSFYADGELLTVIEVDRGTVCDYFPLPVKQGYTFYGWCTSLSCNYLFDRTQSIDTDLSLHAKWVIIGDSEEVFSVSIVGLKDTVSIIPVLEGRTVPTPDEPIRVGEMIEGYYIDQTYKYKYDFNMPVTTSFSLFAKWVVAPRHTVSFVTDTSETIEPYSVKHNAMLLEPQQPRREGFAFLGWAVNARGADLFNFDTDRITEDTVLYALWEWIPESKYTVTFVKNNGQEDETHVFIDQAIATPSVTKESSDFVGWYWDAQLERPFVYDPNGSYPEEFTLYAKWHDKLRIGSYQVQLTIEEDGYKLLRYYGTEEHLSIPAELDGVSVVEIGAFVFSQCTAVDVFIPASVKVIGEDAFSYCFTLEEITFGNQSQLVAIGNNAFRGVAAKLLQLPETLRTIGEYAFANTSLINVVIDGPAEICRNAFASCENLTYFYGAHVTTIGAYSFERCGQLSTVIVDDCVMVDTAAFSRCESLVSISLPNCLEIWDNAFERCSTLQIVSCDALRHLGDNVFLRSGQLRQCNLPDVEYIGTMAFGYCWALGTIELGQELQTIGERAFDHCTHVGFRFVESNSLYGTKDGSLVSGAKLVMAGNIVEGNYTIPDGITSAEPFAFANGSAIRSLTICASFNDFGLSAMCLSNLITVSVEAGNDVYSVKNGCIYSGNTLVRFFNYESVTTWEMPEGINIAMGAFANSQYLTEVILSDDYTTIDLGAFYQCLSLERVSNTGHLIEIQPLAFAECASLTHMDVSDDVAIGQFAFYHSGMTEYDTDDV